MAGEGRTLPKAHNTYFSLFLVCPAGLPVRRRRLETSNQHTVVGFSSIHPSKRVGPANREGPGLFPNHPSVRGLVPSNRPIGLSSFFRGFFSYRACAIGPEGRHHVFRDKHTYLLVWLGTFPSALPFTHSTMSHILHRNNQ